MTGSARLLNVLHGLGHTASADTVSKHDTALAIINSNGDGREIKIPRNISTYLPQLSETTTTLTKRRSPEKAPLVLRTGSSCRMKTPDLMNWLRKQL